MGYFKSQKHQNKTKFKWQKLCLDSNYRTLDSPQEFIPKVLTCGSSSKKYTKPSDNRKGLNHIPPTKNGVDYICCEGVCPCIITEKNKKHDM